MTEENLTQKLAEIQKKLKAPKSQFNKFASFYYRNCEDIMEAVKPLLGDLALLVGDEIVQMGDRYYVKATAAITNGINKIEVCACAREAYDKKGMDEAQITGATSSYARKYALNGLFAIDDTRDADSQNNTKKVKPIPKDEPEVVEEGLENVEPTECPKHKGRFFENRIDHLGETVYGHFWDKDDGTVAVCLGKGFTDFKPAQ